MGEEILNILKDYAIPRDVDINGDAYDYVVEENNFIDIVERINSITHTGKFADVILEVLNDNSSSSDIDCNRDGIDFVIKEDDFVYVKNEFINKFNENVYNV